MFQLNCLWHLWIYGCAGWPKNVVDWETYFCKGFGLQFLSGCCLHVLSGKLKLALQHGLAVY